MRRIKKYVWPVIGETRVLDSVAHKEPIRQEHVVQSSLGSVVGEFKRDWTKRTLLARRVQMRYGEDLMQGNKCA